MCFSRRLGRYSVIDYHIRRLVLVETSGTRRVVPIIAPACVPAFLSICRSVPSVLELPVLSIDFFILPGLQLPMHTRHLYDYYDL